MTTCNTSMRTSRSTTAPSRSWSRARRGGDRRDRRVGRRDLRSVARGRAGGCVRPAALGGRARCASPPGARRTLIARVAGTLLEKRGDAAVVDVGGVGYLVHVSLQSMARLPGEGGEVRLRTYTHVRDDALQLFGFATEEEERLFLMLIDVSGVGPRLAQTILSGMPASALAEARVAV